MRKFTDRELKFFNLARELSLTSNSSRQKIGAVIVRKNKVIATGVNSSTRSHPLQMHYNRFRTKISVPIGHKLHAEITAILNAGKLDLTDSAIYVYREVTGSMRATARPCEACTEALRDRGVLKFFYTTADGYAFEQIMSHK